MRKRSHPRGLRGKQLTANEPGHHPHVSACSGSDGSYLHGGRKRWLYILSHQSVTGRCVSALSDSSMNSQSVAAPDHMLAWHDLSKTALGHGRRSSSNSAGEISSQCLNPSKAHNSFFVGGEGLSQLSAPAGDRSWGWFY